MNSASVEKPVPRAQFGELGYLTQKSDSALILCSISSSTCLRVLGGPKSRNLRTTTFHASQSSVPGIGMDGSCCERFVMRSMAALEGCFLTGLILPPPPSTPDELVKDTSANAAAAATTLSPDELPPCFVAQLALWPAFQWAFWQSAPQYLIPSALHAQVLCFSPGSSSLPHCAHGMAKPSAAISGVAMPYFLYAAFI
eukprot:CAMPEP_0181387046 /NCGR_PEP_ID=MMETSP1106-20121128/23492_1 /TAXON_ID=81844 /ORGANISM="Mantoniella antarctica, Strain SL-175" /LENGTH=197 /DNA_ID=CAMNT_0023507363 /DNA_START=170 /DNA_END=760 /DNA_ORIENTATION=-